MNRRKFLAALGVAPIAAAVPVVGVAAGSGPLDPDSILTESGLGYLHDVDPIRIALDAACLAVNSCEGEPIDVACRTSDFMPPNTCSFEHGIAHGMAYILKMQADTTLALAARKPQEQHQ